MQLRSVERHSFLKKYVYRVLDVNTDFLILSLFITKKRKMQKRGTANNRAHVKLVLAHFLKNFF